MKTLYSTFDFARLLHATTTPILPRHFQQHGLYNAVMANSEFQYVRNFELNDTLLPATWIVVRIDGRGFSKLCKKYEFEKPNDRRGIELMNAAAVRGPCLWTRSAFLHLSCESG